MKKQLARFSVHQTSKVVAVLYFVFAALFFIPIGIWELFNVSDKSIAIMSFLFPFLYMIGTYIAFAIVTFIYNFVAKGFGGIEFTVNDVDHPQ